MQTKKFAKLEEQKHITLYFCNILCGSNVMIQKGIVVGNIPQKLKILRRNMSIMGFTSLNFEGGQANDDDYIKVIGS